jgi:hypothetical protein
MLRTFARNNIPLMAIILFTIVFGIVQLFKPDFLYNRDGSIRVFGVGYKNRTIMPIWLFSIILGILCYLSVLYYLTYPKLF